MFKCLTLKLSSAVKCKLIISLKIFRQITNSSGLSNNPSIIRFELSPSSPVQWWARPIMIKNVSFV